MRRFVFVLFGCAACATVADLEVNHVDAGRADDHEDSDDAALPSAADAGADGSSTPTPDSTPSPLACGCDAGSSCCVRSSAAPACTDPMSCNDPGSLVVGCSRSSTDGRDCCWRPDGGVARSSFGAGCDPSTAACVDDGDCVGQGDKCTTLTCNGVALGVCAASAPSWFVCP